jgi:hypothetical protein
MFLWNKMRPVRRADNLAAMCESIQCGILNISQPYRPPRPAKGIALLLLYTATILPFTICWMNKPLFRYKCYLISENQ